MKSVKLATESGLFESALSSGKSMRKGLRWGRIIIRARYFVALNVRLWLTCRRRRLLRNKAVMMVPVREVVVVVDVPSAAVGKASAQDRR